MMRSVSVDQSKGYHVEVEDLLWEKEKIMASVMEDGGTSSGLGISSEAASVQDLDKRGVGSVMHDEQASTLSTSSREGGEGGEESSRNAGPSGPQERASAGATTSTAETEGQCSKAGHVQQSGREMNKDRLLRDGEEQKSGESGTKLDWCLRGQEAQFVEGATIVEDFLSPFIQEEVKKLPGVFPQLEDNNLALLCLARLGSRERHRLRAVSRGWREALTSEALYAARTAIEHLEESIVVLFFSSAGPYLRLFNPTTAESIRLSPINLLENISFESLRLTVAGRMIYIYSREGKAAGTDNFFLCYDTVKHRWQGCPGVGQTGEYLLATADWVSGQLLVVSNDVSGMLLGNVPECEQAQVATWDPRTNQWDHCLKVPPWLHYCHLTSVASINGRFFIFMIEVVSGSLRAVEYDPLDKLWIPVARFPTAEPQITTLGGGLYGIASGVVWKLGEDGWEYLANLPRHVNHCRVHNDCDKWCKTISHCEEMIMRLSGFLCTVRTWLHWMQMEGRWMVKASIQLLDVETHSQPPVPADGWQRLDLKIDDGVGIIASCGVAIS